MKHLVVLLFTCFGSTSKFKNFKEKKNPANFFLVFAFLVQVLTQ